MVAVGETVIDRPVPSNVPEEQEPEYQRQLAPVPRLPPITDKEVVPPGQTLLGEAFAPVATREIELIVRIVLVNDVLLHEPSALT